MSKEKPLTEPGFYQKFARENGWAEVPFGTKDTTWPDVDKEISFARRDPIVQIFFDSHLSSLFFLGSWNGKRVRLGLNFPNDLEGSPDFAYPFTSIQIKVGAGVRGHYFLSTKSLFTITPKNIKKWVPEKIGPVRLFTDPSRPIPTWWKPLKKWYLGLPYQMTIWISPGHVSMYYCPSHGRFFRGPLLTKDIPAALVQLTYVAKCLSPKRAKVKRK